MSVGIGGDLDKWFKNRFNNVYAMDIDSDGLGSSTDEDGTTLWGRINQFGEEEYTYNMKEVIKKVMLDDKK